MYSKFSHLLFCFLNWHTSPYRPVSDRFYRRVVKRPNLVGNGISGHLRQNLTTSHMVEIVARYMVANLIALLAHHIVKRWVISICSIYTCIFFICQFCICFLEANWCSIYVIYTQHYIAQKLWLLHFKTFHYITAELCSLH